MRKSSPWGFFVKRSKKSHTCEEGGAHLRRWGTPHNFCLAFIGELQNQLFIKKLLK